VYGNNQIIHDNYISNPLGSCMSSTLQLSGGDFNCPYDGVYTSDELAMHWQVNNVSICNNILYNNKTGIEIGAGYTPYFPTNSFITNNKVQQAVNYCFTISNESTGNTWSGNKGKLTGSAQLVTPTEHTGTATTSTNIDYASYEAAALTASNVGPNAPL